MCLYTSGKNIGCVPLYLLISEFGIPQCIRHGYVSVEAHSKPSFCLTLYPHTDQQSQLCVPLCLHTDRIPVCLYASIQIGAVCLYTLVAKWRLNERKYSVFQGLEGNRQSRNGAPILAWQASNALMRMASPNEEWSSRGLEATAEAWKGG